VTVSDPEEIKERLIASLRLAMGDDVVDVAATDADDLLAELEGSYPSPGEDLSPGDTRRPHRGAAGRRPHPPPTP
jgi:hypothetical protein